MDRIDIYAGLEAQRPFLRRRECTPRVMEATDFLLDRLCEIQFSEEVQTLEGVSEPS